MFEKFEDSRNEFKELLNDKMEREIVGFLNSNGGNLYIGIDDDRKIVGITGDLNQIQLEIKERIKNNIMPTTLGLFEINVEEYDKKNIIKISVNSGIEKPYYLKKKGLTPTGCFIRVGSATEQLPQSKINSLFSSKTRTSLCNIISPKQDLNFLYLKIYYSEKGFTINDNFLKQLNLIMDDGKYNYLAYLLSDNNDISIKVGTYFGDDVYDLIENEEYGYCSIIKSTNKVLEKFEMINTTYTKITGDPQRKTVKKFDDRAIREAIINAMVHNLWEVENSPKFEIFSNHISITSTGGLSQGIDIQDFLSGYSTPKYPELMRVFRDLELVEQLGTGIKRILKVYDKSVFEFHNNFIKVNFKYRDSTLLDSSKDRKKDREVSKLQNQILNLIEDNKYLTQEELVKIIGKGRTTISLNIKVLKKNGFLERVGSDKSGFWRILK